MRQCCCNDVTHSTNVEADAASSAITDRAVLFTKDDKTTQPQAALANKTPITSPNQQEPESSQLMDAVQLPSVRFRSPEALEKEKARVQQLVNHFVRNATKGCSCIYFKEVTGERCAAHYFLDKRLENLLVAVPADANVAEVRCPIGAIQDIYCFVEDGASCFPPKVLGLMTQDEQELLLMVVYRSDRGGNRRFCLLEETSVTRDTFLECLRILCFYNQSVASGSQAKVGQS